ncbi:DUF4271 domain-containing protein [Rhodocytophaga aerolata]|uniref:DUF4271 domain-containing protein n=1 Tax=Rhodocytophaga aerolata TaxID=455078 RepID=A0ABT8R939_9BACT|nr:DUF4271 domain-containing protein [Rhodocytophaga aerolata]MDO1448604.1 DUF4271 domain-containing protein [Rhodocytophaga aerolata]
MKNGITYLLGIALFLLSGITAVFADEQPTNAYQTVQNLEEQWLVYDKEYKSYVPFLKQMHGTPAALYLELNLDSYKGYILQLTAKQEAYLFIQAQLYKPIAPNQQVLLNIDSLKNTHQKSVILISLYNQAGHTLLPSAAMVRKVSAAAAADINGQKDLAPLKPVNRSGLSNFIILSALLIVSLYAFLWNYHPKAFNSFYSIKYLFSLSFKEDTVFISRPLSRISMLFIFAHSMLLSFLYMIIQKSSGELALNDRYLQAAVSFFDLFAYFFVATIIVFGLILGKYIFTSLLGNLFNLSKVVHLHFFEYLLYSRVFYTILVAGVFVIYISYPALLPAAIEEVILIIIIFNFARLFIINFALNKLTSVKNLYLFSYLCATELTPLLIGIKVLIGK